MLNPKYRRKDIQLGYRLQYKALLENDVSIYEIKYFNDAGIEEVVGKVELENPLIK